MASDSQSTGFAVDAEHSHVVGALIANVKELASRIEIETRGIIARGPFLPYETSAHPFCQRENRDTVTQAVARVNEPAANAWMAPLSAWCRGALFVFGNCSRHELL